MIAVIIVIQHKDQYCVKYHNFGLCLSCCKATVVHELWHGRKLANWAYGAFWGPTGGAVSTQMGVEM